MQIQMIDDENEIHNETVNNSVAIDNVNDGCATVISKKERPQKRNDSRYLLCLYLSYPTEEQKQRLKNMAKAFNLENKMRHKRMLKIANTPTEAAKMVMAARKDREIAERQYRLWLRRKRRLDEKQYLKEFTEACRQYAKVIRNSRPIDNNQDFQDEQDVSR